MVARSCRIRPARRRFWLALGLLLVLLPGRAPAQDSPPPEDDFGRWLRRTAGCRIKLVEATAPRSFGCRSLRLDQQLAGLMSIRFLQEGSSTAGHLVFAGVLMPGSRPMRCREGSCTPELPLRLQVSAMAAGNLGGPLSLPQARVAQGTCQIERHRAICEARDSEGASWQAETRW